MSFRITLLRLGDRGQSRRRRCNLKLGNGLGANLQEGFGVPAAALDICSQTQPAITGKAGIGGYGIGVRLRHLCLPLATATLEPVQPRSVRRLILL